MDDGDGTMSSAVRILLAEDDQDMRALLAMTLRSRGWQVIECQSGTQLMDMLTGSLLNGQPGGFDLVISDIRMPGESGLQVLASLGRHSGFPPSILITAFGGEATHAHARELGAVAVLDKPFQMDRLIGLVDNVLASRRLE